MAEEEKTFYERCCRFVVSLIAKKPQYYREKRERTRKALFEKKKTKFRLALREFEDITKRYDAWSSRYSRAKEKFNRIYHAFQIAEEDYNRDELSRALKFTRMDIEPWEALLFAQFVGIITAIVLLLIPIVLMFTIGLSTLSLIVLIFPVLIFPLGVVYLLSNYPFYCAKRRRVKTIARMPEAINYMVMSMRLTPTIDRAVEYAAESVDEPLSSDLKRVLWNVQMRKYNSAEDSIVAFADEWGDWSDDFKRSLYTIRAAPLERSEASLHRTLDKATQIMLEGTSAKIATFADALSTPAMVLFTLGSILPLVLAALLPVLPIVARIGSLELTISLIVLLDILLPIFTMIYAYHILGTRPGVTTPPQIPEILSPTEKKLFITIPAVIGAALLGIGIWLTTTSFLGTLLIVWAIGLPIAIYCLLTSRDANRERTNILKLEEEFPTGLFQLGSRLAEGKPLEHALEQTSITLRRTSISETFKRILYNLHLTRTSLHDILFGHTGVFKKFPSRTVSATMKTVVGAVKKDPLTAGETIVAISGYLRELNKTEQNMRDKLKTITNMMVVTALFIAPLVLGVTLILYVVISGYFTQFGTLEFGGWSLGAGATPIPIPIFSLAIGIYLVLLVMVTMYFCMGIQHGEDKVIRKVAIGKYLPTSLAIYTVATLFVQMFFGSL